MKHYLIEFFIFILMDLSIGQFGFGTLGKVLWLNYKMFVYFWYYSISGNKSGQIQAQPLLNEYNVFPLLGKNSYSLTTECQHVFSQ